MASGFYLKIDSVKHDDVGNYSCLAEGEGGCSAQQSAMLTIVEETKMDQEGTKQSCIFDGQVYLNNDL